MKWWAAAKLLQSCPTLCNPIDGSPPGSPVPGILQARTLEWFAIAFSNAWKWKVKVKSFSPIRLFTPSWTAAHQAPQSMVFSWQECWSGVPLLNRSISRNKCLDKFVSIISTRDSWVLNHELYFWEWLLKILMKNKNTGMDPKPQLTVGV